mgnify:CR=1 FL=1
MSLIYKGLFSRGVNNVFTYFTTKLLYWLGLAFTISISKTKIELGTIIADLVRILYANPEGIKSFTYNETLNQVEVVLLSSMSSEHVEAVFRNLHINTMEDTEDNQEKIQNQLGKGIIKYWFWRVLNSK